MSFWEKPERRSGITLIVVFLMLHSAPSEAQETEAQWAEYFSGAIPWFRNFWLPRISASEASLLEKVDIRIVRGDASSPCKMPAPTIAYSDQDRVTGSPYIEFCLRRFMFLRSRNRISFVPMTIWTTAEMPKASEIVVDYVEYLAREDWMDAVGELRGEQRRLHCEFELWEFQRERSPDNKHCSRNLSSKEIDEFRLWWQRRLDNPASAANQIRRSAGDETSIREALKNFDNQIAYLTADTILLHELAHIVYGDIFSQSQGPEEDKNREVRADRWVLDRIKSLDDKDAQTTRWLVYASTMEYLLQIASVSGESELGQRVFSGADILIQQFDELLKSDPEFMRYLESVDKAAMLALRKQFQDTKAEIEERRRSISRSLKNDTTQLCTNVLLMVDKARDHFEGAIDRKKGQDKSDAGTFDSTVEATSFGAKCYVIKYSEFPDKPTLVCSRQFYADCGTARKQLDMLWQPFRECIVSRFPKATVSMKPSGFVPPVRTYEPLISMEAKGFIRTERGRSVELGLSLTQKFRQNDPRPECTVRIEADVN